MNKEKVDQGHLDLVEDVEIILNEAKDFQFHDFKNQAYAAPKMAFNEKMEWLIKNMKAGKYDN